LLCTNCEQTKHSVNTFSVFSWALDWGEWSDLCRPECCCLFHSYRKGLHALRRYWMSKIVSVKTRANHTFAQATCFPSRVIPFHYKTTARIWNQMSITTHTRER
jgi:hypothetical protein